MLSIVESDNSAHGMDTPATIAKALKGSGFFEPNQEIKETQEENIKDNTSVDFGKLAKKESKIIVSSVSDEDDKESAPELILETRNSDSIIHNPNKIQKQQSNKTTFENSNKIIAESGTLKVNDKLSPVRRYTQKALVKAQNAAKNKETERQARFQNKNVVSP